MFGGWVPQISKSPRHLNVSRNWGPSFEIKGLEKEKNGKRKNRKPVPTEGERKNSFWTGYRCTIYVMLDLRAFIRKCGKNLKIFQSVKI